MTLGDRLGLSDARERFLVRAMQSVLAGLIVYGLATFRLGMAANGVIALVVTLLPAFLRREYGYSMGAGLVLWITAAVFLHSVGLLGPYGQYPWYDNVTHTVSATLIAGLGYSSLRAFERHSDEIDVPSEFRAIFVVVFVLAAGVVWELVEFASARLSRAIGARAPLVVRGIDDIVTDMIFNAIGAVVVAVRGTSYFDGVVAFFGRRLRSEREE